MTLSSRHATMIEKVCANLGIFTYIDVVAGLKELQSVKEDRDVIRLPTPRQVWKCLAISPWARPKGSGIQPQIYSYAGEINMPEEKTERKRREVKLSEMKARPDGSLTVPRGTDASIPSGESFTLEGDLKVRGKLHAEGSMVVLGTLDLSDCEDFTGEGLIRTRKLIGKSSVNYSAETGVVDGATGKPFMEISMDDLERNTAHAEAEAAYQEECDHDEGRGWTPAPTAPEEEPYVHCRHCGAIQEVRIQIILTREGEEWFARMGEEDEGGSIGFGSNPRQAVMALGSQLRGEGEDRWAAKLAEKFGPRTLGGFEADRLGVIINNHLINALLRNPTTVDGYEMAKEDIADAKGYLELLETRISLAEHRIRSGWTGARLGGK